MNALTPPAPPARLVVSGDVRIATYEWGDADAQPVVALHGFASSAVLNWHHSGWTRELVRAGYRVIGIDQRGHGESDSPHDPREYAMGAFVGDLLAVLDTYMIDEAYLVGYSLGARVGWQALVDLPDRLTRGVLGGIPDGEPLSRFRVDEARAFADHGTEIEDRLTSAYIGMASRIPGNDVDALVSLVDGMRGGQQPDPENPPTQPVLFATGSDDGILERSRRLQEATPGSEFFEIPGRHHFNAPTSRDYREAAIRFLGAGG